jgi:flagellin-like hook-associated protein FlgL
MNNAITGLASTLSTAVNDTQSSIVDIQKQLAAGKKTLNPAENGVITRLSAQSSGYATVVDNIVAARNVINVAQSGLTSIASIITQMKNLATQAASVGLTDSDRESLQVTFSNLATQVGNLGTSASVNGNNLLAGTDLTVRTDIDGSGVPTTTISASDITTISTTIAALNISTIALASTAMSSLATQLETVSTDQSNLSASDGALAAQGKNAQTLSDGLAKVVDTIQNVDSTKLQAMLQNMNTQQSIDYYLVSQMNTEAAAVLTIFR